MIKYLRWNFYTNKTCKRHAKKIKICLFKFVKIFCVLNLTLSEINSTSSHKRDKYEFHFVLFFSFFFLLFYRLFIFVCACIFLNSFIKINVTHHIRTFHCCFMFKQFVTWKPSYVPTFNKLYLILFNKYYYWMYLTIK